MNEQAVEVRSILVPLDGSKLSEQALPWAVSLAQKHKSELVLLRVGLRPDVWTVKDLEHLHAYQDEQKAFSLEYLREVEKKLQAEGPLQIRIEYASGSPSKCIVERCEELGVCMVVMNSHGRDGLSRLFMGSVAERVVRHAHCPVLLVRQGEPNKTEEA